MVGDGAQDTSFLAAVDRYSRDLRAVPELDKWLGNHVVQLADVASVAEEIVAAALEMAAGEEVARMVVRNHCGNHAFRPRDMAETYVPRRNEPPDGGLADGRVAARGRGLRVEQEHWGYHGPVDGDGDRTAHGIA
ncbi:hypothetical protein LY78DRAFT_124732 [Colletotrichum sublineola]|nr:hypothetical protein LY78DRAFT_124732 [Colletotrichum sublineola]